MYQTVLNKIEKAEIIDYPFPHIEILNLFERSTFDEIVSAQELNLDPVANDRELVDLLARKGWKPIPFPGTTDNVETYLNWRENGGRVLNTNTCEGYGVTYRLYNIQSPVLKSLNEFLQSEEFCAAIARKFGVDREACVYDAGIQKYLDGYEISPHPDIRKKALTYMVNVNPAQNSEALEYHTHYMKFKPEKSYVGCYWEHNHASERCWVPWDWCESVKQQRANNSLVLFSPGDSTLHAIRANYDHLATQRTQLYGNLWYKQPSGISLSPDWEHYVISETKDSSLRRKVPNFVKKPLKVMTGRSSLRSGKRAIKV